MWRFFLRVQRKIAAPSNKSLSQQRLRLARQEGTLAQSLKICNRTLSQLLISKETGPSPTS